MRASTLEVADQVGFCPALDKQRRPRLSKTRSARVSPPRRTLWWAGKLVGRLGAWALIGCSSAHPTAVATDAGTPEAHSICSEGDFQKCVGSRGCVGARVCEHDEWRDCYCPAVGDAAALGEAGAAGATNGS